VPPCLGGDVSRVKFPEFLHHVKRKEMDVVRRIMALEGAGPARAILNLRTACVKKFLGKTYDGRFALVVLQTYPVAEITIIQGRGRAVEFGDGGAVESEAHREQQRLGQSILAPSAACQVSWKPAPAVPRLYVPNS